MKVAGFDNADSSWSHVASQYVMPCGMRKVGVVKAAGFDNADSCWSRVASQYVMPCGMRKDGVVKADRLR